MPPASASKKASTARGGGRGHRRKGAGHGEEHENSERWLVTYADLLTVLLALFIVLFAISALNESKFQQLKYSLAAVFGDGSVGVLDSGPALNQSNENSIAQPPEQPDVPDTDDPWVPAIPELNGFLPEDPGAANGADPKNKPVSSPAQPLDKVTISTGDKALDGAIRTELESFEKIKREINSYLEKAGLVGAVQYAIDGRGLIVTVVTDALVFPGNSATLLPRGEKLLAAIAPAVKKVPNNVEVDGFTNQVDVSTYPYPSGWELSSARASAVVRYLEAHGLADRQLSAVGFSDQRPLIDPKDPDSITRNRRVEIVVLSTLPSLAGDALEKASHDLDAEKAAAQKPAAANKVAATPPAAADQAAGVTPAGGDQPMTDTPTGGTAVGKATPGKTAAGGTAAGGTAAGEAGQAARGANPATNPANATSPANATNPATNPANKANNPATNPANKPANQPDAPSSPTGATAPAK